MFEEETAEDSVGATEAEHETEVETTDETAATEEEASDLSGEVYYEIDGEEVSASQILEWKSGHMKDADYTQKTQSLSDERKTFQKSKDAFDQKLEMLDALQGDIEAAVLGDFKEIDLDKVLNEEGMEEYIKAQREIERRKGTVSSLAEKYSDILNQRYADGHKEISSELGWDDESKKTKDLSLIKSYVKESGMTDNEFAKVSSPKVMRAIYEAAQYRKLMAEKPTVMKQVKKAQKMSKPAAKQKTAVKSLAERMYGTK